MPFICLAQATTIRLFEICWFTKVMSVLILTIFTNFVVCIDLYRFYLFVISDSYRCISMILVNFIFFYGKYPFLVLFEYKLLQEFTRNIPLELIHELLRYGRFLHKIFPYFSNAFFKNSFTSFH